MLLLLQEEKEQLIEYRSTVASLVGRAKTVVQLRPRSAESPLDGATPIRAVCDYKQIEVPEDESPFSPPPPPPTNKPARPLLPVLLLPDGGQRSKNPRIVLEICTILRLAGSRKSSSTDR